MFFLRYSLMNYLPTLALNLHPPNLCLLSSRDQVAYRCELPAPDQQFRTVSSTGIFFFSTGVWTQGLSGRHLSHSTSPSDKLLSNNQKLHMWHRTVMIHLGKWTTVGISNKWNLLWNWFSVMEGREPIEVNSIRKPSPYFPQGWTRWCHTQ
jgi:hypothetical protein